MEKEHSVDDIEQRIQQMIAMLDDPEIGEGAKTTIREGLRKLSEGGFRAAYESQLVYRARTDLNAFAECVYGLPPFPHHKEITKVLQDDTKKRVLIIASPGSAKCAPARTRVVASDGRLTQIKDLQVGEQVLSINPSTLKMEEKPVLWKQMTGNKECFEIRTKSGYKVAVTADHRMYTFDGWKECRDIKVGDFMAAPYLVPEPSSTVPISSEEEIKLLAYWIAEGARRKGRNSAVVICTASHEMFDEIKSDVSLFGWEAVPTLRNGKLVAVRVNKSGADQHPRELFLKHGLDPGTCGAFEKFVPDAIFRAPNDQVALFLNRLFACDGALSVTTKKRSQPGVYTATISYTSVSRQLIDGIRHLLLRFGIRSSVSQGQGSYRNEDGERIYTSTYYKLSINEGQLVHKFMNEIGMFTKDDRFTPELKQSTRTTPLNSVTDRIPSGWRDQMIKPTFYYTKHHNIRVDKKGGTYRGKVAAVAEIEDNDALAKVASSDIRWDEVVSIESVGVHETYDIEVEDNHNFFADGLLSHNSTYVSNIFPAWWMGKNPEKAAILVSNTATQASAFTASIREIIESDPKYKSVFPESRPDAARGWTREVLFLGNRDNKSRPDPNLFATGMTGPVLGRRAELIIVDDPTSQQDATSEKIMEDQKLWFKQTLMSRLKPGGRCVVILTRWHDKDLASMLVNDMDFEVVHMVAIGDDEGGAYVDFLPPGKQPEDGTVDPRLLDIQETIKAEGYKVKIAKSHTAGTRMCVRKYLYADGEKALWKQEHSLESLNRIKQDYGSVQFNLVYQGDPTGLQGDIFKREWFSYYGPDEDKKRVPKDAAWFQSVDVAVSQNKRADYTVVATMARDTEGNIYIHDVWRDRIEAPDQPKLIVKEYRKYPKVMWVLIETVAYQLSLFQNVIREGIPARPFKPEKNKVMRARSSAAFFEARKVYFRRDSESAKWLEYVLDEFTSFPRGEHDDVVDTVTSLLEELALSVTGDPVEVEIGFG